MNVSDNGVAKIVFTHLSGFTVMAHFHVSATHSLRKGKPPSDTQGTHIAGGVKTVL